MDYSNPEIPEGINTSKQHPLKDFFVLSIGVLGGIALCAFLLGLFAERLAVYVPFSIERELMDKVEMETITTENTSETQAYLDQLAKQILPYMGLPEDMSINITHIDEPVQNAFASLGGEISIYQGLIDILPNENALAMVIAHEIAHIKHRDPIIALGRGVVVGLFLTAIAGTSTDRFMGNVITDTGTLTILSFNREQERDADHAALHAVAKHYGHINGADALFKAFIQLDEEHGNVPEFFNTHPLSEHRIADIQSQAKENYWQVNGKTTLLPESIKQANTGTN